MKVGLLVCREGYWCAGRVTGVQGGLLVYREGYWCAIPSQRLLYRVGQMNPHKFKLVGNTHTKRNYNI